MKETLTFSESSKGWTCFLPFHPDLMFSCQNRFFSIKDGQLYLHNDEENTDRNIFYGEETISKIKTVINNEPDLDKIYKNVIQESNKPWKTTLKTNLTEGVIEANEFNQRESRWFAHTRNNELVENYNGQMVQGIGSIISINTLQITFSYMNNLVSVGDTLCQLNGNSEEVIGVIEEINGNVIKVNSITTTPIVGYFAYSKKNSRVEGAKIRGRYLELELETRNKELTELYAVSTNAVISGIHTENDKD